MRAERGLRDGGSPFVVHLHRGIFREPRRPVSGMQAGENRATAGRMPDGQRLRLGRRNMRHRAGRVVRVRERVRPCGVRAGRGLFAG